MRILLSLVLFALIAGFACEDDGFDCYKYCSNLLWGRPTEGSDSIFLIICKLALTDDGTSSPCNATTDSPLLSCYQKCPKCNLTNVLGESTGVFNEYCAKDDRSLDALRVNVGAFCTNWDWQFRQNCTDLAGCDMSTCTFDRTVNDIAYAYSEDTVKYATSFVKLVLGALGYQYGLPTDKGCDIIYRPWKANAANGLQATVIVLTLASITSLIHAL